MSKRSRKNRNLPAPQHGTVSQHGTALPNQQPGGSIRIQGYSAPIPPPGMVREYEEMHPGFLDRWMRTVEKEQTHDHAISDKILEVQTSLEKRGQACAFVIGVLGLGGGIYLFLTGHDVGGGLVVGGTLVSLVTAFLKSQGAPTPEDHGTG